MARLPRSPDDEGTVTVLVVGLTVAMLLVAGLVYDGGRLLAARREAYALADNAARAGAQAVHLDALRTGGTVELVDERVRAAAHTYLDRLGHQGSVTSAGSTVEVTVTIDVPMAVLKIAGIDTRTVTGRGQARLVRGSTEEGR